MAETRHSNGPQYLVLHPKAAVTRYNTLALWLVGGAALLVVCTYVLVMGSRGQGPQWERPQRAVSIAKPLLEAEEKPPPPPPPLQRVVQQPSPPLPRPEPRQVDEDAARRKAALLKALTSTMLVEAFSQDHRDGNTGRSHAGSLPVALQPGAPQTLEVPPVWHPHQPAQSAWETPGRPRTNGLVGGQRAFWQRASGAGTGQWLEASIQPPHSPYTLQAGTVVPAVLTQAITSDLEGQISALVTQDVYDSATGRFLLIPQGSRLFGFYDTDLQATQPRLHLSFKTLYFPNGYSLALHGMPGVDGRGLAGASDQVNRHFFQRYGSAAVLSLITAGITLATYNRGGFFSYSPEDAAVYGAGTVLGRAVGEDLRRVMHIRPTLTIREAYPFNVVVTQDAVFPGPYPFHAAARHGGGHP
jgi:type IV secretory pathway VirB10-like protein